MKMCKFTITLTVTESFTGFTLEMSPSGLAPKSCVQL